MSDKTSARIGERLLQGWTLLAEACERDNTPLMANRTGKLYCAFEDAFVTPGALIHAPLFSFI